LKSEAVPAVLSGNCNSLEETPHDQTPRKSQQAPASAHKDTQKLTRNPRSENSTKTTPLRTKQQSCSRKVVKLKRFQFTGRGHTLGKAATYFPHFAPPFPNMSPQISPSK